MLVIMDLFIFQKNIMDLLLPMIYAMRTPKFKEKGKLAC